MTPVRDTLRGPSLTGAVVVVLGYGRSGRAAASLLADAGATVRVSDSASAERLGIAPHDVPGGPEWLGRDDLSVTRGADMIVASPGVPPTHPIVAEALQSGPPIVSEIELAWWFTETPIVAITGTNGKTTTTELLGAMGRAAAKKTAVCGNVGTPFASVVSETDLELIVLEVSSFQLFLCREFRPHVGALLNLSVDHMDWHADWDHYVNAKGNLFACQRPEDAAVINGADAQVLDRFSDLRAETFRFQEQPVPESGVCIRDERLTFRMQEELEPIFSLSEWNLAGRHHRENLMAAALCARLIGLPDEAICEGARSFRGLPHRMEEVARSGDVVWVNDSKSTNPASLEKALDPDVPTILIAGGVTKGADFREIRGSVRAGARLVLLIGEGERLLDEAFGSVTETVRCGSLERAVEVAFEAAQPGERVLFSPGCASFDQFDNFAHRGDRFKSHVLQRLSVRKFREEGK